MRWVHPTIFPRHALNIVSKHQTCKQCSTIFQIQNQLTNVDRQWVDQHPNFRLRLIVILTGAATPVWQVWQLPYLGFWIFQKQVTQWAKSGDIGAKNRKKWPKNLSNGQKKQVSPPLPSLPKWGNAAPGRDQAWSRGLSWHSPALWPGHQLRVSRHRHDQYYYVPSPPHYWLYCCESSLSFKCQPKYLINGQSYINNVITINYHKFI